jgi:2-C-methyl-D-erythritol 4-phosphate cytidylyltransferase
MGAQQVSQTAAIILAAGAGQRLGSGTGKAFVPVDGTPMVGWSLQAFDASSDVDRILLVVPPAERARGQELITTLGLRKPWTVIPGGETRHDSEFNALEALAPEIIDASVSRVVVHDAARPFVDLTLVRRLLEALAGRPGAIPALPATAMLVSGSSEGLLRDFVPGAWAVQTPQAFRAGPLLEAHRRARAEGFRGSDTASVLERTGQAVAVLEGSPDTFKITTPVDLLRAQVVAQRLARRP